MLLLLRVHLTIFNIEPYTVGPQYSHIVLWTLYVPMMLDNNYYLLKSGEKTIINKMLEMCSLVSHCAQWSQTQC